MSVILLLNMVEDVEIGLIVWVECGLVFDVVLCVGIWCLCV